MLSLLADHDVEGQFSQLVWMFESDDWKGIWHHLDVTAHTFRSPGIPVDSPDDQVWRICQQKNIVLVTNNRNSDGDDSLGVTLERELRADSLPVLTFANVHRFDKDKAYGPTRIGSSRKSSTSCCPSKTIEARDEFFCREWKATTANSPTTF